MLFIRWFENLFNDQKSYINEPNFNLHKCHPQLKILLVVNGIFFNNIESKLRLVWPVVLASLAFIGFCFELSFIIHGIAEKDNASATEHFCYLIIVFSILLASVCLLGKRRNLMHILKLMNDDFTYIATLGPKYKNKFMGGQLLIKKLCYLYLIFSFVVSFLFIVWCFVSLIYQTLFGKNDENSVRPLAFPVWLSFDNPYRSPNYELFLVFQIILDVGFVQTYSVSVYVLFHILLHCHFLMEMIFLDFEVLFDGLEESVFLLPKSDPRRIEVQLTLNRRIKRIVNWHISVFDFVELTSKVFGAILVYQVTVSALTICLMAYQVADSLDIGKLNILFVLLLCAATVQLWIPCYLGSLLRQQAFGMGEACWNCGWERSALGQFIRPDIIIIIIRAQQQVTIKFPGLPKLELETFSSIMSTSYSYFNILRQYK